MAYEDLEGSLAHVKMLKHTNILSADDADKIIAGLHILQDKLANGELTFSTELEDIHMNMESLLTQEIGDVAGKFHTARSRNDQVATDLHLYLKNRLEIVIDEIKNLQKVQLILIFDIQKFHLIWVLPGKDVQFDLKFPSEFCNQ